MVEINNFYGYMVKKIHKNDKRVHGVMRMDSLIYYKSRMGGFYYFFKEKRRRRH